MSDAREVFAGYLERVELGVGVDFEALCARHPDQEDELRSYLASWEQIESVLRAPGVSRTLARRIAGLQESGDRPELAQEAGAALDPSDEILRRLSEHSGGFGRYHVRGEVARGGQGAVLRVWDEDLRRNLAMKVILGREEDSEGDTPSFDPKSLGRFLEEAQVTGQLDHPGVVPVHELGLDAGGRVYFTMKLVKGETLGDVFRKVQRGAEGWSVTRALGVMLKVCEAMAYAHSKQVVHRDLKPENVMVGRFGEVYVMDWGLARVLGGEDPKDIRIRDPRSTRSFVRTERREHGDESPDSPLVTMDGDVVGTPAYMSPEQALGRTELVGPRSDVYSVGAMLYHLLAGERPYVPAGGRANNYAVWMRVQEGPPRPLRELADVPPELESICEKAMQRDAEQRYSDMGALAEDLRAYLEGRVVQAHEAGAMAELRKWVRRNRTVALTGAVGILAATAGVFGVGWFGSEARAARAARDRLAQIHARAELLAHPATSLQERHHLIELLAEEILAGNVDQETIRTFVLNGRSRDLEPWNESVQTGSRLGLWVWSGGIADFVSDELGIRERVTLRRLDPDGEVVQQRSWTTSSGEPIPAGSGVGTMRLDLEDVPPGRHSVRITYTSQLVRHDDGEEVEVGLPVTFEGSPWKGWLLPFEHEPSSDSLHVSIAPTDLRADAHWESREGGTWGVVTFELPAVPQTKLPLDLELPGVQDAPEADVRLSAGTEELGVRQTFPLHLLQSDASLSIQVGPAFHRLPRPDPHVSTSVRVEFPMERSAGMVVRFRGSAAYGDEDEPSLVASGFDLTFPD